MRRMRRALTIVSVPEDMPNMDHPDPQCVSDNHPLLAQSSVLYAVASQYLRMVATVGSATDMRALDNLAKGYTVLAEQREAEERRARSA